LEALECFLGGSIIISGSQAELRFNTDTAGVNGLVRLLYSYPLQTKKQAVAEPLNLYMLSSPFSSEIGPHTREDIQRFVNIRAAMNVGLSLDLKKAFPETVPVIRPSVITSTVINPN
jgi:hypothetical protein